MKRIYAITVTTTCLMIAVFVFMGRSHFLRQKEDRIKVGMVYISDTSTAFIDNFMRAHRALADEYGDRIEIIAKYNIQEGSEEAAFKELVDAGCGIIFSTSYGYENTAKTYASRYTDIQFCQATGDNANTEPVLRNYHTFMGEIYEGRYASGVAAGMKLRELIDEGKLTPEEARVGYIGAYSYAEVISGYTAFLLGVRSVVPETTMIVNYTESWDDYAREKSSARDLINDGCIILSQHSDTAGLAVVCEEMSKERDIYFVSYNQSMADIAPTTYLTGCRINWAPYFVEAVGAVLEGKRIENVVSGSVRGNDAGAGFDKDWVEMLEVNKIIAADGTQERIDELIADFKRDKVHVFKGNYLGINPSDPSDTWDLNTEYNENSYGSAPSFCYVLQDVITVRGD